MRIESERRLCILKNQEREKRKEEKGKERRKKGREEKRRETGRLY